MRVAIDSSPPPSPVATRLEQTLLIGVPTTKQAELLPVLRSPDRTVREVALILIQLDREAAARRTARHAVRHRQGVARGWVVG